MKTLTIFFAIAGFFEIVNPAPLSLALNDDSVIKGEVHSVTRMKVMVATEYGVIRIPAIQLTDDGRKAAGLDKPASAAMHESRIAPMEAKIQTLEAENVQLRRQGVAAPSNTAARPASLAPDTPKSPGAIQEYKISSTGKQHPSECRYFGSGRPCGPTDEVPCKICGG